jgi:hypothetical protein
MSGYPDGYQDPPYDGTEQVTRRYDLPPGMAFEWVPVKGDPRA